MLSIRRAGVLPTLALIWFLSPVPASDSKSTPPGWDVVRTTSPESVDELKALQSRVKEVNAKVTPSTVALLVGNDPFGNGGMSCGSGVIVSEDGLVLTAAHVIAKPRERVVFVLPDGKRVGGITLGLNSVADSGMAKITDKPPKDYPGAKDGKWPFVEMGKSADLKKGQWIVSLGHPGGPKQDRPPPVRTGRFIGLEKAGFAGQRNDLLNTDATLVGGDSGGPLFDLAGKVVGIHSEIGLTLDMNRHVPLEKYKAEWDRMVRGDIIYANEKLRDKHIKAGLNVYYGDKTDPLDPPKVIKVETDGAGDKAGIEAGDVIVKFNGFPVKTINDLRNMLPSYKIGEKVKVEVLRDDQPVSLEVKLAEKAKEQKE
jgi:serine protease Do